MLFKSYLRSTTIRPFRYTYVSVHGAISTATGTGVKLVGEGFLNTTLLACKFGEMDTVPAKYLSSTEISCPAPSSSTDGLVIVVEVTVNGVDFSTDGTLFTHTRQPFVLSLYPSKAPVGGSTTVFLSGAYFIDSHRLGCSFGTSLVSARWLSTTLVQCESPPWPNEDIVFVEVTIDGQQFTSDRQSFSFISNEVHGVIPSIGPTGGGSLVSIFGEGFIFSADVAARFGGNEVRATFVSSSHLRCVAPEAAESGVVNVSVIVDGVTFETGSDVVFHYTRPPSIAFLEPSWGFKNSGTTVVLHGEGLAKSAQLACSFGIDGLVLPGTFISEWNISCAVPAGIDIGAHLVSVTMNGGDFTATGTTFAVLEEPNILSILPASGPYAGGTAVHVSGINFERSYGHTCLFGTTEVAGQWESSTSMWCTTPPGNRGDSVSFSVTLDGSAYSTSLNFHFWDRISTQYVGGRISSHGYVPENVDVGGYLSDTNTHVCELSPFLHCTVEQFQGHSSGSANLTSFERGFVTPEWSTAKATTPCESHKAERTMVPLVGGEGNSGNRTSLVSTVSSVLRVVPNRGSRNGGTNVLVTGTNFVDTEDLMCRFGPLQVPGRWLASSMMTCISAAGGQAARVPVEVITNGVASVSEPIYFRYEGNPTVAEIHPSFGMVQGGTLISINGDEFAFSSSLKARFGRVSVPATFVSSTELRTTSPASFAGNVDFRVGDNDGPFTSNGELVFVYSNSPIVDEIHPSGGSVAGGLKVFVRGQGFSNSSNLGCKFGEAGVVPGTYISDTEVVCTSPEVAGPTSEVFEVTVNGNDFMSHGILFSYTSTPTVLSITPDNGRADGGTVILVYGVNFVDSDELSCHFGDSLVSGQWISPAVIQCVAPTGANDTIVPLGVTFRAGQVIVGDLDFYYYSQPTVRSILPSHGPVQGGNDVFIFGTKFWFSGGLRARFGMTDVPATFVSPSELRCTLPASSPGVANVSISFNGVDEFYGLDGVVYEYVVVPIVRNLHPSMGSQGGGTSVTVSGNGNKNASALACAFNDTYVPLTSQPAAEVVCVTPQAVINSSASVAVTSDSASSAARSIEVTYVRDAFVTSVYPSGGPISGGSSVRVNGFNFEDMVGLRCVFGAKAVCARWVSSTQVRCTSPPSGSTQVVTLGLEVDGPARLLGGSSFSYYVQPAVSSVAPAMGSMSGRTIVNVVGYNFTFTKDLRAIFGPTDVPVIFLNSSLLRCVTAASPAQSVKFGLGINGRDYEILRGVSYTFRANPQVEALKPSRGSIFGGTIVSVQGSGFEQTSHLGCRFGTDDSDVVQAAFVATDEILCTAPAVSKVGTRSLEVTVNGEDFSGSGRRFSYHDKPVISSVIPVYSNSFGATVVSVQGAHFSDSEVLRCHFGDSSETSGLWISRTLIECVLPAPHIAGLMPGMMVPSAVSFNGQDKTPAVDFRLDSPARITQMLIGAGSTSGGTVVMFKGTEFVFTGDLWARFGRSEVPVTFLSPQQLTCVTPAGEAGVVRVTLHVEQHLYTNDSVLFEYVDDVAVPATVNTLPTSADIATVVLGGSTVSETSHFGYRFGGTTIGPADAMSRGRAACNVPGWVDYGTVSLECTVDGEIFSTAVLNLQHEVVPALTINPASGPRAGGTNVIVTGRRFLAADEIGCTFGKSVVPARWLSTQAIQCESPAWEEEFSKAPVGVISYGYVLPGRTNFQYSSAFTASILPAVGDASSGAVVTGRGFDTRMPWFCLFGSDKSPGLVTDDGTSLLCVLPHRTERDSHVEVGVSTRPLLPPVDNDLLFIYLAGAFEALSLVPISGTVFGGSSIVVTVRHGFGSSRPPLECKFGAVGSSRSTWLNGTAVLCVTPSSPYRGQVPVVLHSSGGVGYQKESELHYLFYYPPTIAFVYPLEVVASDSASAVVTVTGANFERTSDLSCRIGNVVTRARWVSESVLDCPHVGIDPGDYEVAISNNMVDFIAAEAHLRIVEKTSLAVSSGHITPGLGSVGGGTVIEVCGPGIGLLGSPRYCVVGDVSANASILSEDRVSCVTTAQDEGRVPVKVCDYSNTCSPWQGEFSFVRLPFLKSISAGSGPVRGGSAVTLHTSETCGENHGATWCRVGEITTLASSVEENSVTCTIPRVKGGKVSVAISCSAHGFSVPLSFRYTSEMTVYDISPLSASSDGGSIVHVRGRAFQNTVDGGNASMGLLCLFDEICTPALWASEALVLCRTPPRSPGVGLLRISASPQGQVLASANLTYVIRSPQAEGYVQSPTAGPMDGGTIVSIVGTQANRSGGSVLCKFGEHTSAPVESNLSEVTCVTPTARVQGPAMVALVYLDHSETVGEFEYQEYLNLEAVHPYVVDVHGGTKVGVLFSGNVVSPVSGSNLSCRFGGMISPALMPSNASRVECIAPSRSRGLTALAIWSGEKLLSQGDLTVWYTPLPVVSNINPNRGFSGHQSVVNIHGHNFVDSPGLTCVFGDVKGSHVKWLTSSHLQCTPPDLTPGRAHVVVSHDGVSFSRASNTSTYVVYQHLDARALDSPERSIEGWIVTTLNSNNIPRLGGLECLFGTLRIAATVLSNTAVECVGPRQDLGDVSLGLQLAGGDIVQGYRMQKQILATPREPIVNRMWPTAGSTTGGVSIDIGGAHFPNSTQLLCRFQGSSNVVDVKAKRITSSAVMCTSPPWSLPEEGVAVNVVVDEKVVAITRDFTAGFSFGVSPLIQEIYPSLGPVFGGTEVQILGANFRDSKSLACVVCTKSTDRCTSVAGRWLSSQKVRCTTPSHEPGATTVHVTNIGLGEMSDGEAFVFVPAPRIAGVSPNSGSLEGGVKVLVSGTNLAFTGSLLCRFGKRMVHAGFDESGVICTAPRVSEAQEVFLEVSVNGVDFTSDTQVYKYGRHNTDRWPAIAQPSYGGGRGDTVVRVDIEQPPDFEVKHEYGSTTGNDTAPQVVVFPSVSCQSLTCWGERTVSARLGSKNCSDETAGAALDVFPSVELLSIEPTSGWESGGENVVVHGRGLNDNALTCCRFGKVTTAAVMLSTASLRCVSPPWSGESSRAVTVEVSHDCYAFYGSDIKFQYHPEILHGLHFSRSRSIRSAAGDRKQPLHCRAHDRGMNVSRHNDGPHLVCTFPEDSLLELGSRQTYKLATNSTPTKEPTILVPSSGAVDGGSIVTMSGVKTPADGAFCIFTDPLGSTPFARAILSWKANTVSCSTPYWPSSGSVMPYIARDGVDIGVLGRPFVYNRQPILLTMKPSSSHEQGTLLRIRAIGLGFSTDPTCGFFDMENILQAFSAAVWTTPHEVWCGSPALPPGDVQVELSMNGVDYTVGSGLTFTILSTPAVVSISPSTGSSGGGTEVTVLGTRFRSEHRAICKFQETEVPATIVDASHVMCKTPIARELQHAHDVHFTLAMNGEPIPFADAQLSFAYVPNPVVTAVSPRASPAIGGTVVSLTGRSCINEGNGVALKFRDKLTAGSVISADPLSCEFPPRQEAIVEVTVRPHSGNDDMSETGSKFFYKSSLPNSAFTGTLSRYSGSAKHVMEGRQNAFVFTSNTHVYDLLADGVPANREICACGNDSSNTCLERDGYHLTNANMIISSSQGASQSQEVQVMTIIPDNGPPAGGTPVFVTGASFGFNRDATCHFGLRWTRAVVLDSTHALCFSPPTSGKEVVDLFVTFDNQHLASQVARYHYVDVPVISDARPRIIHSGAGNEDIVVEGRGFRNSSLLTCMLDNSAVMPAKYMSSRSAVCSIARNSTEFVHLELTNNGNDFSSSGTRLMFAPRPVVTDIYPSVGPVSGGTDVMVSGLYFKDVPQLACLFGEHTSTATWLTAEKIRCRIPPAHSPGRVAAGVSLNSNTLGSRPVSFEYLPSSGVIVESARPSFGDTDGGTVVTLRVFNLRSAVDATCRFGKTSDVVARVVDNYTVQCVAPAGPAGSTAIQLGTSTHGLSISSAAFVYVLRPTVDSLHPSSGATDGGTVVKVLGSGFVNTTALECRFGLRSALSVVFVSPGEIECISPPSLSPSVVPLTTSVQGVSSKSFVTYRYSLHAMVLEVSPREIVFNESSWLSITGANFVNSPELMCLFNSSFPAAARWLSSSLLRCAVPPNCQPSSDPMLVGASNNGRDISLSVATIHIRPLAIIHKIWPSRGAIGQRTHVSTLLRLYSERLKDNLAHEHVLCLFDDVPAKAVVQLVPYEECSIKGEGLPTSCVTVNCTAPVQQMPTDVSVRVVGDGGIVISNLATLSYDGIVRVISLTPPSGPRGGGTKVTIHLGVDGLPPVPSGVGCQFSDTENSLYVEGQKVGEGNGLLTVVCFSPPWRIQSGLNALVKVDVMVDGVSKVDGSLTFVYSSQAAIFALAPGCGVEKGGTEIRIQGVGFMSHTQMVCTFTHDPISQLDRAAVHSSTTPALRLSDETLLCVSPAHTPGPSYVAVVADGHTVDGLLEYTFGVLPQISSVKLPGGPTSGGTVVDLSGGNCVVLPSDDDCRIGSDSAPATFANNTSLICASSLAQCGLYPFKINMNAERPGQSNLSFADFPEIRVIALDPSYGWFMGGANITLGVTGLNSYYVDMALFCSFGNHREAPVSVDFSAGRVVCLLPTLRQAGLRRGSAETDAMVNLISIDANSGAELVSSTRIFHYVLPMTITAVAPNHGQAGTRVRVLGNHFDDRFGLECQFGTYRTPTTFLTSQRIDCDAPAIAAGQVRLTVLSGKTLSAWHTGAEFTFEPPAVLFSNTPGRDRHGEKTAVTVAGSGFQQSADLVCRFGALTTRGTVLNSTHVRCVAPPQGRGDVLVAISVNGVDFSSASDLFLRDTEAVITHVFPSEGSVNGGTTLAVTSNLLTDVSNLSCTFTTKAHPSISSAAEMRNNTIMCTTPPTPGRRAGIVEVSVTNGKETLARGGSFGFINPPVAYAIHSEINRERGGERIIVFGERFTQNSELACKFSDVGTGGGAVVVANFISTMNFSCTIPAWHTEIATGARVALEFTMNGVDYISIGPEFVLQPMAAITLVSPTVGPVTGETAVAIVGVSFPKDNLRCRFGTHVVSAWVISDAHVICISPKAPNGRAEKVSLHLTVEGEEVTTFGAGFAYLPSFSNPDVDATRRQILFKHETEGGERILLPQTSTLPTVSLLEPSSCSSSGSMEVLVHGENFVSSTALTCSFGDVYVPAMFWSSSAVRCRAPPHIPADVVLEVSVDGTNFSTSGLTFRFHEDPSILSIDPTHGPVEGSTMVTVTGRQFRNSSAVTCRFGDVMVPTLYITSSQLMCWTPPTEREGSSVYIQVRLSRLSAS